MRRIRGPSLAILLVLACAACFGARSTRSHPDRSLITREEIEGTGFRNAFEVVEALHSNWLRARRAEASPGQPGEVLVYLDGTRLGGVETLRTIELGPVVYIRHFDGMAATARWGLDHGQGVILVSTHPM